jgi:hypothetical protein
MRPCSKMSKSSFFIKKKKNDVWIKSIPEFQKPVINFPVYEAMLVNPCVSSTLTNILQKSIPMLFKD